MSHKIEFTKENLDKDLYELYTLRECYKSNK